MSVAIEFKDVWKEFSIIHNRSYTLKIKVLSFLYPRLREFREEFWVLKDLNFSIAQGEAFGLIGPNGAGKSTLLYLLARTFYPTRGEITVNGMVAPMISLGLGFSGELTGLENISLNLSLYGFSRKEIQSRIDPIVEFSGLGDFIDTSIKNYSSGMRARLGFAIAVHQDPDIILLDDVYAVGDAEFQDKCINKLTEFKERKKTLVFVSHGLDAVRSLCDRACWLSHGEVKGIGPTSEIIHAYMESVKTNERSAGIGAGLDTASLPATEVK